MREVRGILLWGIGLPAAAALLAWPTHGLSLALLAGYPALFVKAARHYRLRRGWPAPDARLFAAACVTGKFPQAVGLARYWAGRIGRRPSRIIEYKGSDAAPAGPQTLSPA